MPIRFLNFFDDMYKFLYGSNKNTLVFNGRQKKFKGRVIGKAPSAKFDGRGEFQGKVIPMKRRKIRKGK